MEKVEKFEANFREAVLMAINTGVYNPNLAQGSFVKIFNRFRAKTGITNRGISKEEYNFWRGIFLDVLEKAGAEIQDCPFTRIKYKKKTIVTPNMRKGAPGRETYHRFRSG